MKRKYRRILLTGGTGQIGWELQRSLKSQGEIIAPSRKEFDLSKPESLRTKIKEWKPDLIINPAAYTLVDQAENEPELAFTINATAPRVMAEEAAKLNIPLLHYSTDYVFDGNKTTPYNEDDDPNPLNVYGESKLSGDRSIQKVLEDHLILRTQWVYSQRRNNFLKTMLKKFQEQSEVKVVNDQIGTPTSARLIADITARLVSTKICSVSNNISGLFNLTASGQTTWFGFAKEILATMDTVTSIIPISSLEYEVKAVRPTRSLLDNHKLISNIGMFQLDWKTVLAKEIEGGSENF
jgi:dTDP-4-dehydrorhamnose reductase